MIITLYQSLDAWLSDGSNVYLSSIEQKHPKNYPSHLQQKIIVQGWQKIIDASYPNRTSDLVITVRVTRLTTGPRRLDVYLWYTVGDAGELSTFNYIAFEFGRGGQAEYAN